MPTMDTLDELAAGLASGDALVRRRCAEQLTNLGPEAAPAAVELVAATATDDEELLEAVVGALESVEQPREADVERLSALLESSEGDVGYWSATLLGRLESRAASAVPALVAALESASPPNTRHRAAWALGRIGPTASAAGPALERTKNSDDPRLARLAAKALERVL